MRTQKLILLLLLICLTKTVAEETIQKFSFAPPPDLIRADLYALKTEWTPKAVLILCPGYNGNGEGMIRQAEWQEFARKHQLGLVGLSFASDGSSLDIGERGYYYVSQGSGQTFLNGLRKIYGRDLPLLFYGFSGGAHFTSRFVEWQPERVLSWCAYSAGWWDTPKLAACNPPGIVACGKTDPRYSASLTYFKQGRDVGKTWTWIGIPNVDHVPCQKLEQFARAYFSEILQGKYGKGISIDIVFAKTKRIELGITGPLTGWLPSENLKSHREKLCEK